MKVSEDFLLLLLNAHVIAAAQNLCEYDMNITSVQWVAKSIINTHLLLPTSSAVQDGIIQLFDNGGNYEFNIHLTHLQTFAHTSQHLQ